MARFDDARAIGRDDAAAHTDESDGAHAGECNGTRTNKCAEARTDERAGACADEHGAARERTRGATPANKRKAARRGVHGLRFKMAVFIGLLIVALMAVDAAWNVHLQQDQAEREAREKAEVLADEMRAVWDFIDMNQDVINRNDDGTFRTKTLVCVVAAKSVSTLFTGNTDYSIRFTSETPRQKAAAPDEFEQRAFDAFAADPTLASYSDVQTDPETGQRTFRYVEPLYVTETCLECHGEPAGQVDQYGYAKEGMRVGDVGGAMSITEPMSIYEQGIGASVLQQAVMVLVMVVAAAIGIYFATRRLILRPIESLSRAAKRIEAGRFDYELPAGGERPGGADELSEFTRDFDAMARELQRLYTDLSGEVDIRTAEMQRLNDQLTRQKNDLADALSALAEESAYKNEFFAMVSHELRTPLTSILAFARILQDEPGARLDDKTRDAVDEIEANATLLLNLVNNILTLSKAEARKNELLPEPVDFVDLVGFVKKTLEPLAADKNIALSAKADADVPVSMADWEKLRRVVENLVDNAIKYTHRGGFVNVRVTFEPGAPEGGRRAHAESVRADDAAHGAAHGASPLSPGTIVITVADDGMGIDEADLDGIFDLYKQAGQSSMRRYRGTGLGLAVVKELTELHGGTVSVASRRKEGSTFTVRIPYVPTRDDEEGGLL